jgi:hypothetical protein
MKKAIRDLAGIVGLALLGWGVLMPADASAQETSIAGVVTDTSGAVLPGVTVEASSPVLIEGSRTAVSDSQGFYRVIELRPGTYRVTFTLPGFRVVVREGLQLTTGFTATVNMQLAVGAVEETVTVSSASPIVDVQSVVQREVITQETLDSLPIAKSVQSFVAIVPGLQVSAANRDVGGTTGDRPLGTTIHGGREGDQHIYYNGLRSNNFNSAGTGGGGGYSIYFNPAAIEEINLETGQQTISSSSGGVIISVIPKEGGNLFSGTFLINGANGDLQTSNLTDDLRARGVTTVPRIKGIFDLNAGLGGPVVKEKLWFYGAYRRWGSENYVGGNKFFSATPLAFVPNPDRTQDAYDQNLATDYNGRLTSQVSQKDKVSFALDLQRRCLCYQGITGNISPEATAFTLDRSHYWQGKWTRTATNRLLLQAGTSHNKMNWNQAPQPGVGPDVVSTVELSTGLRYRSTGQFNSRIQDEGYNSSTYNTNFSVNYVAGSHSFFAGSNVMHARPTTDWRMNGDREYRFLNGQPNQVLLRTMPRHEMNRMNDLAIYASDRWTVDRLTVNAAVSFTRFTGYVPEQSVPAGLYLPAITFPEVPDVVNWRDITPRVGLSYDPWGDGKTAVKFSFAKFLVGHAGDVVNRDNPQSTRADNVVRSWVDTNRNFFDDCDHLNPDANGECGPMSNRLFGQPTSRSTFQDPETQRGSGVRDYSWELVTGVQRQVMSGVSVDVAYFRRSYGNFLATDNRRVLPSDFDPFCITAPSDSRLPGGGGNQVCGLFDITPQKFGQVDDFVTFADTYGKRTEVYNGADVTINARLPRRAFVQGGMNIGRTATDDCEVRPDSPQKIFCGVSPKFLTDVKLAISYPLPVWDVALSATVQSSPGPMITATHTFTSTEAAGSLGRPLANGRNGQVELVEPGTLFGERLNQLDLRMTKNFKWSRTTFRGIVDLYNAFNSNAVLAVNTTYGPAWQRPLIILPGRFFKFGLQMTF